MEQLKIFGLVSEKKNTADRDIDRQVGGGGGDASWERWEPLLVVFKDEWVGGGLQTDREWGIIWGVFRDEWEDYQLIENEGTFIGY